MLLTIFQTIQATKNRCFALVFLCFFISVTTFAQNLITNGDFESGGNGIGFQINGSGYNLISAPFSGNTSSGNYAFTTDPKPMNTANFITSQDHTSGAGNLMMVIDGNTTGGGQRFWKAGNNGGGICGLKLGITYTFSYWIQSVSTTVTGTTTQADIGINFNNANSVTLVSGSALAPLPALGWRKVVYTFVPTNACVNIELWNNNTNPVGNDFAVDDFSLTAPLTITSVSKSPVSCPQGTDGSININIYGGLGPYTYNLTGTATTSDTIGTFLNLAAGNYNVSVTDAELKTVNWPTVINISTPLDDIAITATGSTSICVGNSVKLDASGGYGNYTWSPGTGLNTTSGGSVNAAPTVTTTYTLTSDNGVNGSELIVNGGFESGTTLTGFTTQYTSASASTTDTSSPKQYYISGSTTNLSKDFTWGCVPNTGSNMFMADSDSNATTEILNQTVTVLPNTNYQISYFIQSLGVFGSINDPNPSTLEVYINGVLITSLINNTAGCNWRKVTGMWNSGIAVSAIIIIKNSTVAGTGNDFAIDDISFKGLNCIQTKTIEITVSTGSSDTAFTYPTPVCQSASSTLPVITNPSTFTTSGTWSKDSGVGTLSINSSTGEINPSLSTPGTYIVKYAVPLVGCQPASFSTFSITISPQANAGSDGSTKVCDDSSSAINLSTLITGQQTGGFWSRTTGSGGIFDSIAGTFTPAPGATSSTFTYTITVSAPCTNDTSLATVTIDSTPILAITCGTATGNSVSFNWNSIADATSYSYSYSINSGAAVTGVLSAATTSFTVNGLTPGQNVSIILTPAGSVCAKQATFNCVSSNCPTPIVDVISDFPTCANENVSIPTFTSATSGVTFNWTNTNTSIGIAASGSGATIPTFNVINTTAILQTATISVTANDGTCTGPAMIFNLDVNPLPAVTISATQNSVCSGTATTINFNGTPNATVTYTVDFGANQFLVLDSSGNDTLPTGNLTANTIYSLVSVLNPITNCSQTQSGTAAISINALPTVTISGTTAVCSGSGTPISFNGTPNAIVTYTVNSGVNQTILLDVFGQATLPSGNLIANSDYSLVSIVDTNSCSQIQTGNATISVDALPTVTISGTGLICSGTGTSINFNGTPNTVVTYTLNSSTNQTVSLDGFGNASLPTGNLTFDALYSLVSVQDLSTTCFQTQSGTASVKVISLPTATISGSTTICLGTSTTMQFSGTPNAIVTYTINSGINQKVNLDATGKADLLTGNLIVATDYSLVSIEDSTKTCSQTLSGTATIGINSLPTVAISTSSPICSGTGTTVDFIGTPDAIVTYKVNSGANQTITLDALGQATLPTGNLISNTIYILVSVSDSVTSCSQLQSGSAPITVTPLPISTISGTTSICSGASTLISFNGTPNVTVTYTIDSMTNQIIVLDSTGKATLPTGNLTSNTIYSLVSVSDTTTTCLQLQTGTATISINAAPDIVPATISQSICSGQSSGVLLTSTTLGTIFNWTVIESGVTGASLGTGNNISQVLNSSSPINVGTAEYTVTPTANGCSGLPVVITVSVSPTPTAVATPDKDIICSGETTAIALSSSNTQTTFSWNAIQNNVSGATQDSGNAIAQVLQTSINNFGEAVYAITPSLNGCSGSTILVPITVNPVPNVSTNAFNNPICSGTATNIELTSNVPGTTFTWSVAQTNVIGAVPGNGNSIAQIIETSGIGIGVAEYTVTPQIYSCIGNPVIVPIQVNPTPEVFAPASTTICSGDSPNISLIPLIIGTTFSWTHLSNKVTGASDGNGDKINQILVAENSLGKVEYTVTPSYKGCSGTPIVITVDVNPAPSVNLENGVLCLEVDGTLKKSLILDTNLSTNLYDFEWFFNNSLSPISGATDSSYEAKELGDYYVNVRFKSTGCSVKSNTSTVTEVNPTKSFGVAVSDAFTEVATITVTGQNGITTYLYQIDDGALQTSNVFNGIGAGNYTIRVTDSDGCTDYDEDVQVIDYPKYFTPNGDGFNDTWNIKGLSDQSNTTLLIYDRYGKLLKQISPKGQGWDGTFNGVQLPATDYWFTVDYVEPNNDLNKLFKAHFSLKR